MKMPLEMEMKKKSDEIIAHAVAHLPIVKEFAMKLGIVEIVNELVPSQMDEDPGTIFSRNDPGHPFREDPSVPSGRIFRKSGQRSFCSAKIQRRRHSRTITWRGSSTRPTTQAP